MLSSARFLSLFNTTRCYAETYFVISENASLGHEYHQYPYTNPKRSDKQNDFDAADTVFYINCRLSF